MNQLFQRLNVRKSRRKSTIPEPAVNEQPKREPRKQSLPQQRSSPKKDSQRRASSLPSPSKAKTASPEKAKSSPGFRGSLGRRRRRGREKESSAAPTTPLVLARPTPATPETVASPESPEYHETRSRRTSLTTEIEYDSTRRLAEELEAGVLDVDHRNRIAKAVAALDRKGNELFEQGLYDEAFIRYEKAFRLKRRTLDEEGKTPEQSSLDVDLRSNDPVQRRSILASVATSINNMTYLKQRAGLADSEETMAQYMKALKMKREILGPDHLSVGKTLNNIGSVFYLKREFDPALAAYRDALRIMEKQLGANHLDVVTVISNIGDVHCATGNWDDALDEYRKALDLRWRLLGRQDPKVVRLMEQIASLETGKQPQKEADELSDSEDEAFTKEDKRRHEVFLQDVKVLQDELEEDMKFFDLMERQSAIDMVKDKTRIFREMRAMMNGEEVDESGTGTEDGSLGSLVEVAPVAQERDPHGSKGNLHLSANERSDALLGVKERVAKLRAKREVKALTQPVKDAPYMQPTVASSGKTIHPPFLEPPRRSTIEAGLQSLRKWSLTDATAASGTTESTRHLACAPPLGSSTGSVTLVGTGSS